MRVIWEKLKNEPARVAMLVRLAVMLVAEFGLPLSDGVVFGIYAIVELLTNEGGVRPNVVPNALAEQRVESGYNPTTPLAKDPEPIDVMVSRRRMQASVDKLEGR